MRWGVTDEMVNDHMTSAICLREITLCQELSQGPCFIVSIFSDLRWSNINGIILHLPNFVLRCDFVVHLLFIRIFQAMLGQRYGYQPLPSFIEAQEFEILHQVARSEKLQNIRFLENWYIRDDNAMPPVYCLQVGYPPFFNPSQKNIIVIKGFQY